MNKCDLEKIIMKTIQENDGPFCSEADFQLALAMKLKENQDYNYDVKCEYTPDFDSGVHTDIVVFDCDNKKAIPIELKYKTKEDAVGNIILKNQGAHNNNCYDFWKDVSRIENYILKSITYKNHDCDAKNGFAVFLTNDKSYLRENKKADSYYYNFRICNRESVTGSLKWAKGHAPKGRPDIKLKGSYHISWVKNIDYKSKSLKYELLILEITDRKSKSCQNIKL